jgi:hypothetical protein
VARLLPAAALAQLEAAVDDDDNRCWVCDRFITGPAAAVVVLTDGRMKLVRLAHAGCTTSAVFPLPGLTGALAERNRSGEGYGMATMLGVREREPRALIFLEPEFLTAGPDEDPLEPFAAALGLTPISGAVEAIDPPATDSFTIVRIEEGLGLEVPAGIDTVPATEEEVSSWLEAADGRAIVVVARGLGLRRAERRIEEALALRPAWGGVARITEGD